MQLAAKMDGWLCTFMDLVSTYSANHRAAMWGGTLNKMSPAQKDKYHSSHLYMYVEATELISQKQRLGWCLPELGSGPEGNMAKDGQGVQWTGD